MKYTCPCCGFLTFDEPSGNYEICGICGWEDDPVQLMNPCLRGGANLGDLWYEQHRTLTFIPVNVTEYKGIVRDARWRPLTHEEAIYFKNKVKSGLDYFNTACLGEVKYYWES